MTAGIAHDFNNVLSLILGYSEMLHAQPPAARRRARRPTRCWARSSPPRRTPPRCSAGCGNSTVPPTRGSRKQSIDLNALVEQAAALTRPRWHGQALGQGVTIDLRCELAPGLPALLADAAELREMLTNLIFNAVDALPEGGTITLRTTLEPAGAASPRARSCSRWPTRARA